MQSFLVAVSPVESINCTYSQKKVMKFIVVIVEVYYCCQLHIEFYATLAEILGVARDSR
jgi:hypothetical protein